MCFESETWLCAFGVFVAVLLRCCTSQHPYSGQSKPPMYGDYEAQRHWMEITVNLPLNQWYHNSSFNELQYWGLDYPPLTAYHSYVCGLVAYFINPAYVALKTSRGYENENHKLFMRYTALISDLLIYIPSVILYYICTTKMYKKGDVKCQNRMLISTPLSIILALFYPGIILIDHGHFQYNCVSLGFAIFAITFLCIHKNILSAAFFCLALNYKQMELYHSLPFFMYLLSTCVPKPGQNIFAGVKKLTCIGTTVIVTFLIIWTPFLLDMRDAKQVFQRLFPVVRGVFEDKVANIWCTLNVFYKFKLNYDHYTMLRYCTISTLVAVLPSSADLFLRPNIKKFIPALINSSLAFFLFSFQVHEKSILLAAMPVMLYLPIKPLPCFWFLIISTFSMFPLIMKDGLILAFLALTVFYVASFQITLTYSKERFKTSHAFFHEVKTFMKDIMVVCDVQVALKIIKTHQTIIYNLFVCIAMIVSLTGCLLLICLTIFFKPPQHYPDIFSLSISIFSCLHFLGFLIYFNLEQFKIGQASEDVRYIKLKAS